MIQLASVTRERATVEPTLDRALGRWDLTAIGINQVIGSAIFLMPSQVAAQVGNWGPLAFLLAGLASLLVALCFAEVSSRFDKTGGPYLYTRAAFGRLAGFEVGWMLWFTRAASHASVVNGVALAVGFYLPSVTRGLGRASLITTLLVFLAVINVRGIRISSVFVNLVTLAKLLPLGIFIVVGLFFVDLHRLTEVPTVTVNEAATAALLLIFTFGGYDVVPVPAGEASDPRRHVPFALVATIVSVTAIMTLGQIVAAGTLPGLAQSSTPLADASLLFLGAGGALMIGLGSVISMTGNNMGQILSGSRVLFALAENGDLPPVLARIHPRYRTPANAILFTSAVALVLALSGSFAKLAVVSAVARLVAYIGACASTLALRRLSFEGRVLPATFVIPFGPVVPLAAIAVSLAILLGATRDQLFWGAVALLGGAILFRLGRPPSR